MRARAASSRTKTATITAIFSDCGLHGVWALPIRCRSPDPPRGKCIAPTPPHTGAIHAPHDPLRRSRRRRGHYRRLLELGHRADARVEVHGELQERAPVVRVDGFYQSCSVSARADAFVSDSSDSRAWITVHDASFSTGGVERVGVADSRGSVASTISKNPFFRARPRARRRYSSARTTSPTRSKA